MDIAELLKQILLTPEDYNLRDSFFKELEKREIKPISFTERTIQELKIHFLIQKGIKLEVFKMDKNFTTYLFLSSEGSFELNIDFDTLIENEEWREDIFIAPYLHMQSGIKNWENTLNVDFSGYTSIVLYYCVTDDIVENYISKWDLSSCEKILLTSSTMQDNFTEKGFDLILQMNLPKIKQITLQNRSRKLEKKLLI